MRVIFITNLYPSDKEPYKGSFVKNIYDEFCKLGINVHVVKLEYYGKSKWFKLLAFFSFYLKSFFSALFSKSEDVYYIHYASHASLGVLLAGFFRRLNIVTNVHGSDVVPEESNGRILSTVKCFISKAILVRSNCVVSPSSYFKGIIHNKYNISLNSIFVSPSGGVNCSVFTPNESNFNAPNITFGYVGRLEKDKGIFDLIDCYIGLLEANSNVNLIIVGAGSCYYKVKKIIDNYESIELHKGKTQHELANIYNAIDYLVFPSCRRSESLGLVPIEAMMCGTPVISSTIGATKDYIRDQLAYFSFESGNKTELLMSLHKALLIDPDEYQKLVSLGCEISQEYESKKVINDLVSFFKFNFDKGSS
jgi:glycosyltransferase involved in cell wall biosynthesis